MESLKSRPKQGRRPDDALRTQISPLEQPCGPSRNNAGNRGRPEIRIGAPDGKEGKRCGIPNDPRDTAIATRQSWIMARRDAVRNPRVIRLGHQTGSSDWVIRLGHQSGSSVWVIRLGHQSGSSVWVISLGHQSGPSVWAVSLGRQSGPSVWAFGDPSDRTSCRRREVPRGVRRGAACRALTRNSGAPPAGGIKRNRGQDQKSTLTPA